MAMGPATASMVIESWAVRDCTGVEESVTFMVKSEVAAVIGVPVMAPVEAFRLRPAGSVPIDMLHEYGLVPPAAARACEYGVPAVPLGNELVVIESAWIAALMVMERLAVLDCAGEEESVTLTVKFEVAAVMGV